MEQRDRPVIELREALVSPALRARVKASVASTIFRWFEADAPRVAHSEASALADQVLDDLLLR